MTARSFFDAKRLASAPLARFDPVEVGRLHGLSRELSLALWRRITRVLIAAARRDPSVVSADIADTFGDAERRFRAEAARIAAAGGHALPVPGKRDWTITADELPHLAPGRLTREAFEATGRIDGAQAASDAAVEARAPTSPRESVDGTAALPSRFRTRALRDVVDAARRLPHAPRTATWQAATPGTPLFAITAQRAVTLLRHAVDAGEIDAESPDVLAALAQRRSGSPLPAALQRTMQRALGVSLAGVRIHTDALAASAARAVRADAFTVGEDIYFADGTYDPSSTRGRALIAHELAHVAQALRGQVASPSAPRVSQPDDPLERAADAFAARAAHLAPDAPALGESNARATLGESNARATLGESNARATLDENVSRSNIGEIKPALGDAAHAAPSGAHVIHRSPASRVGSDDMWHQVFAGDSAPVGKLARVQAPLGVYLKALPSPDAAPTTALLPFDRPVYVVRRSGQPSLAQRWVYVATSDGGVGFIEERYLAIGPPEPTATLYRVQPNQRLGDIIDDKFGDRISKGNDARLYAQAIYDANKGRAGIRLTPVALGAFQRIARTSAEQDTVRIYLGVRVIEGQALWIPNEAFIQARKATGEITSGSGGRVSELVDAAVTAAEMQAGQVVGGLEGAYEAIADLFKGAVDLVRMAFSMVKTQLLGGFLAVMVRTGKAVYDFVSHVPDLAKALGSYVATRWTSAGPFGKGRFIGEITGYIAANVLLALATGGGSAALSLAQASRAGSQLARVALLLLELTDAASNPLALLERASKGVRFAEDLTAKLRSALARDANLATHGADAATHGADAAERARHIEHGAEKVTANAIEEGARLGPQPNGRKPPMISKAVSIEGTTFVLEFMKDLSPTARGLVRKIEKQGWVRIREIAKDDLVQISKWFNKEVAVVQPPYGRLRLVLGERSGVLKRVLKEGEVFVVHTHPIMRSESKHFIRDLSNAGPHVEAVVDWSGQVIFYSKNGILNPRNAAGHLMPLPQFVAGFIGSDGAIIGYAKIELIEKGADTIIKVVE